MRPVSVSAVQGSTAHRALDRAKVGMLPKVTYFPELDDLEHCLKVLPSVWFVTVNLTTVAWLLTLSLAAGSLGPE